MYTATLCELNIDCEWVTEMTWQPSRPSQDNSPTQKAAGPAAPGRWWWVRVMSACAGRGSHEVHSKQAKTADLPSLLLGGS